MIQIINGFQHIFSEIPCIRGRYQLFTFLRVHPFTTRCRILLLNFREATSGNLTLSQVPHEILSLWVMILSNIPRSGLVNYNHTNTHHIPAVISISVIT